ncbi:MAG: transposase [Gammaproteobacteria bacterium]|nr:transposase [Gammaproteobacteria bacterium]
MKSVTEILGGAQFLLGLSFDLQDIFEEYLTESHRAFLEMLRVIEEHLPTKERVYRGKGRIPFDNLPIIRSFLAKSFFKIETNRDLLNRLKSDSTLRKICGFTKIPSEATFSRRLKEFSDNHIMEQFLYPMVRKYHSELIVGHISRDSTSISAREKPTNKKKDVSVNKPKRKRGRPKKGEERPPKEKKRLLRQISMRSGKALKELDKACAWGCKKNSQGNVHYWKGYKLHLDVTDLGIPVAAVVTGANVHDSQPAIPMEKLTEKNVTHLYSLMDAAYDAPEIRGYIRGRGRVELIDFNKRRKDNREPMDPAMKKRFKIRSTVERSNAHLKDWLLPSKIMVKGYSKVTSLLMTGVLCLAALKILQYFILPKLETVI